MNNKLGLLSFFMFLIFAINSSFAQTDDHSYKKYFKTLECSTKTAPEQTVVRLQNNMIHTGREGQGNLFSAALNENNGQVYQDIEFHRISALSGSWNINDQFSLTITYDPKLPPTLSNLGLVGAVTNAGVELLCRVSCFAFDRRKHQAHLDNCSTAPEMRAIEVDIYAGLNGSQTQSTLVENSLYQRAGELLKERTISEFLVVEIRSDGGHSYCLDASSLQQFDSVKDQIIAIAPSVERSEIEFNVHEIFYCGNN